MMFVASDISIWLRYRVVNSVLNLLPVPTAYRLARAVGYFSSVNPSLAKEFDGYLCHLPGMSDVSAEEVLRRSNALQSVVKLDDHRMAVEPVADVVNQVTCSGVEHLDNALSFGKGVLLLTSHFGRLGMLASGLNGLGYKGSFLTATVDQRASNLTPMQKWIAHRNGISVQRFLKSEWIMSEDSAIRMRSVLRKNEILIGVLDAFSSRSAERVLFSFLDGSIRIPSGMMRMAALSGARIVYVLMIDRGYENVEMRFWELEGDAQEAFAHAFRLLEANVKMFPHQWWLLPHLSSFWAK